MAAAAETHASELAAAQAEIARLRQEATLREATLLAEATSRELEEEHHQTTLLSLGKERRERQEFKNIN
jgi:hypothetical protein